MDRSACEAFVSEHKSTLPEFLSIGHWKITYQFGPCDDPDNIAECWRNTPYDLATISINPEKVKDPDHLLEVLFHELTHVILAPFDLYRGNYCAGLERKSIEDRREDFIWANAVEKGVINLERLWRRHLKALYLASLEPTNGDPSG